MSISGNADYDRWEELQIARILYGLTSEEQIEFDNLSQNKSHEQAQLLEHVIASLDVAWTDPKSMPLPEHLRKAVRSRALEELKVNLSPPVAASATASVPTVRSNKLPWFVAATCAAIAVMTLLSTRQFQPVKVASVDVSQQRSKLISTADDLIQLKWLKGLTPISGAEGDIVWSPSRQQGYMRFRGLTVNVPTVEQYQLWIFDEEQSEKTPIDGGVFDINSEQEVIIPIQAKLHVQKAYLFAITIEKPGGVVVSSRERLPLMATVN